MGTAVAQGVAWLIKWFILRPLFYILIQVLWPFYLWPWRQFLGCLRDGMEQRRVAYERVADFYYPWLFRATRRYFAPKKEPQENRHRVRCVIVNVLLYVLVLYIIARWYGLAQSITMTITI